MPRALGGVAGRPRPRGAGVLSLLQLLLSLSTHTVLSHALPVFHVLKEEAHEPTGFNDPQMWVYMGTAIALVLLGGAFAGLTIALMGQDEVYLRVIAQSGEGAEKRNAVKVLNLLKRGKHWVLVTLLVGNVITNETLPIVLDRSIGGGYAAAISSTVLVIIFGEIVPQSICVRFGLPIGAWMSNFVLTLMWIFAPITWPIAKLLDRLLGEDHGTTYKKAGLKTLVTLHKTMGETGADRLNEDEVAIISGVLDLKAKSVGTIMTPMNDVFVLSADAVLDEEMMDEIMREGYSRIPIHEPKNRTNFVGMLLVKMLITYDPEDARRVSDFSLATLPETDPRTSCLDIINFFQEGKSHMVLVSDYPGEDHGALGVVTLEDVIEELIGEEIIDESDVYIDVHKAIRRLAPAPTHRARLLSKSSATDFPPTGDNANDADTDLDEAKPSSYVPERSAKRLSMSGSEPARSPRASIVVRRKSSTSSPSADGRSAQRKLFTGSDFRQQLRHLGPSNSARQPKATRINTVKVKPGVGTIPEGAPMAIPRETRSVEQSPARHIVTPMATAAQEGIGRDLVSPGKGASDGTKAVQAGYDTMSRSGVSLNGDSSPRNSPSVSRSRPGTSSRISSSRSRLRERDGGADADAQVDGSKDPDRNAEESDSTVGSLHARSPFTAAAKRATTARSGSITESFVDHGGVKKLVLETTSSSDDAATSSPTTADEQHAASASSAVIEVDGTAAPGARVAPGQVVLERHHRHSRSHSHANGHGHGQANGENEDANRSRRKKKSKRKKANRDEDGPAGEAAQDENTPLLERKNSR